MNVLARPALALSSLTLMRGRKKLADAVSFDVPAGHYVELHGPNGSGKTTLLRTLAHLQEAPRQGTIAPTDRLASSFYFGHQSGFRPELRVAEQLKLSLHMYGADADDETSVTLLKRVGLAHQADYLIRQLSQGQTRRLMLAVMLSSGRSLWLIDEPFNALDAQAVALLEELMLDHLQRGGATVVATHRPIGEAMPRLAVHCAGIMNLNARQSAWQSVDFALTPRTAFVTQLSTLSGWQSWCWVLKREMAIVASRPQDVAWPSVFHWMVVSLFPFGLGTDPELLQRAAAGIFWISTFFAMLLGAGRLFEVDFEQGALNQIKTAGISLSTLIAAKLMSSWLFIGLPLAIVSFPLGMQYGLPIEVLGVLSLSLALGTLALAGLTCLFACMGLLARQAQVVISLLAIPVFVPVLIFGTASANSLQASLSPAAPLMVLAGLAVLSLLSIPLVAARVLALALE